MANSNTAATTSVNAETLLSTLSPEAREALSNYYRAEVVACLTGDLEASPKVSKAPATANKEASAGKRVRKVQKTNDGSDLSAAAWVKQTDAENKKAKKAQVAPKDMAELAKSVGLNITGQYVSILRSQARKAAADKRTKKEQAKHEAEVKAQRQANAAKARATRAANKEQSKK